MQSKAERDAFRKGQRTILEEIRHILAAGNGGAATHTIIGGYIRGRLMEIREAEQIERDRAIHS